MSCMQNIFKDIHIGHEWPILVKDRINLNQLVRYAGACGDFNPIHFDYDMASKAGFKRPIAHGLLVMGFVGEAVTKWIPSNYLRCIDVRFRGVTNIEDQITISGKVTDIKKYGSNNEIISELIASDQEGQTKITGTVKFLIPELAE